MEGICMTCLATDRRLFSIEHASKLNLFKFIIQGTIKNPLPISYMLCWECTAQLHNIYKFQIKARRSLQTLESYFNRSLVFPTSGVYPCLSTLQTVTYSIDFLIQPHVKVEVGEVTQNVRSDHNYIGSDAHVPGDPIKTENEFYTQEHVDRGIADVNFEPILDDVKPPDDECFASDSTVSADEGHDVSEKGDGSQSTVMNVTFKGLLEPRRKMPSKPAIEPLHPIVTRSETLVEEMTWREIRISEQQRLDLAAAAKSELQYVTAPLQCDGCILGFWTDRHFAIHNNKYHKQELAHVCDICKCRFEDATSMKEHHKRHSALYDCMKCKFNTRRYDDIVRHHNNHHTTIFRYDCEDCDMVFRASHQLTRHKIRNHKSGHKCKICGEVFNKHTLLNKHRKSHRTATEPEVKQCPICKKMIKQNMRTHIRNYHSGSDPIYCELCKKFYTNQTTYNGHLTYVQAHMTPDKFPFTCEKCDKRFKKESSLLQHEKSAHSDKEKSYCCDLCPKKYFGKKSLKIHIQVIHMQEGRKKVRNYICEECGKAFLSGSTLLAHQVVHTGERPHKCGLCTATFGFKAALYTHNKLVHEKVKRAWPKRKKKSGKSKVKRTPEAEAPDNVEK